MTNKKQILKEIDQAILKEELALPVYTTYISAEKFWSKLSTEVQKKISTDLQILHDDSMRHAMMLEELKKIYNK